MKKHLKIILLILILTGCSKKENIPENTYPLSKLENFSYEDGLYTGERLLDYPSTSDKTASSYKKTDLDNLDYNKEVRFRDIYFRIPEKCEIFKKDDLYFIDFPLAESYNILISFKSLDSDKGLIYFT